MGKKDKSEKKVATKKADPIKKKPAVPISTKEILAKAKALKSKKPVDSSDSSSDSEPPAQKAADDSDDSLDSSSESEESSSDDKKIPSVPVKATPTKKALNSKNESMQKAADDSDDSSDASTTSSDDSDAEDEDEKKSSAPMKVSPSKHTSDSEDDDSESGESSSEEENEETSTTAQSIVPETNKKRKADNEAAAPPKKAKLANGHAEAETSSEEIKSVFVGRLSWNVDKDWLAQEFAECGEVESAHVQMDRDTGRSRGFGYVHFKTADAVEKALALSGKEIDGRPINVDKSHPPDKKASAEKRAQTFGDTTSPPSAVLFVGNLSFGVDEDMLWETFGEHGDVKNVRIPTDRETGKPKGFAYVEFSEVGIAKTAHGALQGFELDGRSIRLDFSQPRDNSGPRGGGHGQGGRGGRGRGGFGGGFGGDRGRGFSRGGRGGDRGGRGWDRGGRGWDRGGRGGDRGGRGRGRGARTGGIASFEGQKINF